MKEERFLRLKKKERDELKKQNKWNPPRQVVKEKVTECAKHWASSKPVNQLDKITGELIKEWNSASEAAIALCGYDSPRSSILGVANKKYGRRTCLGFKWEFSNKKRIKSELSDDLKKTRAERMKKATSSEEARRKCVESRKKSYTKEMAAAHGLKRRGVRMKFPLIYQICPQTNRVVQIWNGVTEAAIELFWDINMRDKIYEHIKGRSKTAYGFIWKREKDMCNSI